MKRIIEKESNKIKEKLGKVYEDRDMSEKFNTANIYKFILEELKYEIAKMRDIASKIVDELNKKIKSKFSTNDTENLVNVDENSIENKEELIIKYITQLEQQEEINEELVFNIEKILYECGTMYAFTYCHNLEEQLKIKDLPIKLQKKYINKLNKCRGKIIAMHNMLFELMFGAYGELEINIYEKITNEKFNDKDKEEMLLDRDIHIQCIKEMDTFKLENPEYYEKIENQIRITINDITNIYMKYLEKCYISVITMRAEINDNFKNIEQEIGKDISIQDIESKRVMDKCYLSEFDSCICSQLIDEINFIQKKEVIDREDTFIVIYQMLVYFLEYIDTYRKYTFEYLNQMNLKSNTLKEIDCLFTIAEIKIHSYIATLEECTKIALTSLGNKNLFLK